MENLTTISLVVGITMGLIEVIKYTLGLFFAYLNKDKDKKDVDSEQRVEIAILRERFDVVMSKLTIIETNHLVHVQESIDNNSKENNKEHREIFIILGRIEERLKQLGR